MLAKHEKSEPWRSDMSFTRSIVPNNGELAAIKWIAREEGKLHSTRSAWRNLRGTHKDQCASSKNQAIRVLLAHNQRGFLRNHANLPQMPDSLKRPSWLAKWILLHYIIDTVCLMENGSFRTFSKGPERKGIPYCRGRLLHPVDWGEGIKFDYFQVDSRFLLGRHYL